MTRRNVRKTNLMLLLLMLLISTTCLAQPINREWRYCRGDKPGAEQTGYDDREWENVGLPHSFSIPYFMASQFYTGYGWYRKHLTLKQTRGKRIFLQFDGVFQEAQVYVNGHLAGSHTGGYTAFLVDLTPYAKRGDNVLAVRVNNLWKATTAPRAGEHVFSGGIYRSVRLVEKSDVAYIRPYGVVVTTPTLEENGGKSSLVDVKVDVEVSDRVRGTLRKDIQILDAEGRIVARGGEEVQNPHLWSPESPYLYEARVRLYDKHRLLDEKSVKFGFRWFNWSKDTGFRLNGKHYFFKGANVHQDQAGWGDAVTEEAARRDVRMIKEAGFTMIRGSHYPHSEAFVDECDRQGLLFWSEAPFWGTAGQKEDGGWTASAYPVVAADTADFERSVMQQLEEMIVQHRNHPSVFAWSMCNEVFFTDAGTLPAVRRLLGRMVERTHQLDPTRKAGIGGAQRPLGKDRIDLIGDVAGYNGDGANIADFQHPDVPNVLTEYGSTTADRPGMYTPGWGDLAKDDGWKGRDWRSGQVIWCGFDHGSQFGDEMAKLGIIDYFRLPKRSWYWYRNSFRGIDPPAPREEGTPAAVHLSASKTDAIGADGTDDVQLVATITDARGRELSNSPSVTLRIKRGPGEFPTGRSITFASGSDIRIQDGACAIALRSYYAGETVVEALSDGLQSDSIVLHFTGAPDYREGVTPLVADRPYVRFVGGKNEWVTYGQDSPTFASSQDEGHSAGLAADGKADTFWQPNPTDEAPTWELDVERTLHVRRVRASFVKPVRATVLVSKDQVIWTRVAEVDGQQEVDLDLRDTPKARFIRFAFDRSQRPQLIDTSIEGRL